MHDYLEIVRDVENCSSKESPETSPNDRRRRVGSARRLGLLRFLAGLISDQILRDTDQPRKGPHDASH